VKTAEGHISPEVKQLIRKMAKANPLWGAPKIHGELLMLGFIISERSAAACEDLPEFSVRKCAILGITEVFDG
jgi:hypothetical protein